MEVGLVCDRCDLFSPITATECSGCGGRLSLGSGQALPHQGAQSAAEPPQSAARQPAIAAESGPPRPHAQTEGKPSSPGAGQHHATAAVAMNECPSCGAEVAPDFKFCGTCGARVASPTGVGADPLSGERRTLFFSAMQAPRPKLILIKGDGLDGSTYVLGGTDHVAGRTEGELLFPDDPMLSPRHANFAVAPDGKLTVTDEQSENGVFLRIRKPVPLKTGDRFLVGEQLFAVEPIPAETAGLDPDPDGTHFFASPRTPAKIRLLQLLRGGLHGNIHCVPKATLSMGREGNDINFPDDPFISGRHAEVSSESVGDGGQLTLTDLGSKNGTFVRISGPRSLEHGDYVFLGQQLLRVEIT